MSCRLLHPGTVTVLAGATSNAVQLEFKNSVTDSGEFVFASERQAAEVSLGFSAVSPQWRR